MTDFDHRFDRHLVLDGFGRSGQATLRKARVAIVGLGGLGSPAALYLTAAGVGALTLIDGDVVDDSNLQRQILYTEADVGRKKVDCARQALSARSRWTDFNALDVRLDARTIESALADCDLVVEATDNFETRFLLNRHCRAKRLPLVIGACTGYVGQVLTLDFSHAKSPCYACLYPENAADAGPAPEAVGVLSSLPGVVGAVEAGEALLLLTRPESALNGKLWTLDVQTMRSRVTQLRGEPSCSCLK